MQTWPERFPGRLEFEIEEFRRLGLDFELDRDRLTNQGQVLLRGRLPHDGDEIPLEVVYPDLFPYLRPQVFAPDRVLDRHQNPYARNLCLLDRSTREWDPSITAAWLVSEQLPYLLSLLEGDPGEMRRAEAPQGEPVSAFFEVARGTIVFVPREVLEIEHDHRAGSGRLGFTLHERPSLRLRAAVVEVAARGPNRRQRSIAKVGEPLAGLFGAHDLRFRWVRLDRVPQGNDAAAVIAAADAEQPGFANPRWQSVAGGEVAVCAVVFPEEVTQGVFEDVWLFAVKIRPEQGGYTEYLTRGDRLTLADLGARTPELAALRDRTIALAGLGALGSALALELAKSGLGELRPLDHDVIDTGTASRWIAGLSAAGHAKVQVVAERIAYDYPFTKVVPFSCDLGSSAFTPTTREETEIDLVDRFLEDADLLIDATAEIGVQQVFADRCDARGVAQLYISATEGALGGLVARVVPEQGGCWLCLQHALMDGSVPSPPSDASATIQPRGCASRTFTGTGFDLLPIVSQAARVASSTLLRSAGPRSLRSKVWVCDLSAADDGAPAWSEHELERHAACPRCAGTAGATGETEADAA